MGKNFNSILRTDPKSLAEKLNNNNGLNSLTKNSNTGGTQNSLMKNLAGSAIPHLENFPKVKNLHFDYATLFLLKNSLNYIYDMYLTLNTFNCLRMSKINKRLTNLNFEYFVNYMINYFYPISKIKNFKIELKSDLEGEVYAIYDYYRVIFFNVIFFILNNTRDLKKEKTLTISVKHHIFTENQGSYYKAIFSFNDDSPYIPYNLLNELLNSLKNTELNSITLDKYKLIDFGLIVSFYIANTVYNSEFNVNTLPNSNNHIIVVNILASNSKESNQQTNMQLSQISMQNTIRSIVVTKIFKKPKTMIEELYYNKILAKLYMDNKNNSDSLINGDLQTKRSSVNLKNRVIKTKNSGNHNDKKTGFNPKELNKKVDKKNPACEGLYDEGMNDSCNIKKIIFYFFINFLFFFRSIR